MTRQRATTERVTPDVLRKRFADKLELLQKQYNDEAFFLESAIKSGNVPQGYIPAVIKGMEDHLNDLSLFCETVLAAKRKRAEVGKLAYREDYLKKKREDYAKRKDAQ
jgi:hypothetical protein